MSSSLPLQYLLLCDRPKTNTNANTIVDHIDAFAQYSTQSVHVLSLFGHWPADLDLRRFDVIIIHYSLSLLSERYLSHTARQAIQHFRGLKVLFIQDEYRAIDAVIKAMQSLRIDVLFTCFPESEISRIYTEAALPNVRKLSQLTGYIPERLLHYPESLPLSARPIDVGYRGRMLPYWYGALGYEKTWIAETWCTRTATLGLHSDVSCHEQDRIYGEAWIDFIRSCKVMLGTESGASVMDFTGALEQRVEDYQLKHPRASFAAVQALFLKPYEGLYTLNQISPRCFEAIALKTGLVLFEGAYSGILEPDRHYIPLQKDFGNLHTVIAQIKDQHALEAMIERAYAEIALNPCYHYRHFIGMVDTVIAEECHARQCLRAQEMYTFETFMVSIKKNAAGGIRRQLFRWYQKLPLRYRMWIKYFLKRAGIRV